MARRPSVSPSRMILMIMCWTVMTVTGSMDARSQSVYERLVMAGPLVEGHAKLEADGANCHVPFEQGAQFGPGGFYVGLSLDADDPEQFYDQPGEQGDLQSR